MRNTNTILSFVIIILLVVVLYDDLGSFEFTRPETSVGAVTFQEAEKTYKDLRSQWFDGKLSDTDFEERINQLKVKDVHGRSWQLGVRTGEWYFNDGQKWVKVSLSAAIQSLASSALIIVMVVLFLIRNAKSTSAPKELPIDTLKARYARGEITKEQFDQMRRDIGIAEQKGSPQI